MDIDNVEDAFVLAPIQEGMLFHSISEPGSGVFIEQICVELVGDLHADILNEAWEDVVNQHGALRTAFVWDGLDTPLQVVRHQIVLPWSMLDWRPFDTEAQSNLRREFLRDDRVQGFDLETAPLTRITLVRLSDVRALMVWTCHHIVLDGWSAALVLNDIFFAYTARMKGCTPDFSDTPTYRDHVERILSRNVDQETDFWRERLNDVQAPTRLIDRLGTQQPGHARAEMRLSADATQNIKSLAQRERVTLNTVLLGAWARLLGAFSHETDVVFGTTMSCRAPEIAKIESAVGLFINTLPMRISLTDTDTGAWLRDIQTAQVQLREHDHTPLAVAQRHSEVPLGTPLIETIVVFENYPDISGGAYEAALNGSGLTVEALDYLEQSNFPIALLVVPGQELTLYLVHDRMRASTAFCEQVLANLEAVLSDMCDPRTILLSDELLPLSSEPLPDEFDTGKFEAQLSQCVAQRAAQAPDAPAIHTLGGTLSYAQLHARAENIASSLVQQGVQQGDFVAFYFDRGPDMIAALLGIAYAGAGFVPLDPEYPSAHAQFVVQDTAARLVLTSAARHAEATVFGCPVHVVGSTESDFTHPSEMSMDGPAYVIHTSGSQGRRKGVVISHRNIAYSTAIRDAVYDAPPTAFLLLSPICFDSAMVGVYWTLMTGGALVLPDPGGEKDVQNLASMIATFDVTHTLCIPQLYSLLLDGADATDLASLQVVIVAGEASTGSLVERHFDSLPAVQLHNEYGPTETTVWCVSTRLGLQDGSGVIPIGRPLPGSRIYILDPAGRPVAPGVAGEMFVSGPGVSAGYLGQPGLTQARFVPNPFHPGARMYRTGDIGYWSADRRIIYLGRSDEQVKIRGFRVEPGEISDHIRKQFGIEQAAVLVRDRVPIDIAKQIDQNAILAALERLGPTAATALLDKISIPPSAASENDTKGPAA